jgi:error-prone DNA polymerase
VLFRSELAPAFSPIKLEQVDDVAKYPARQPIKLEELAEVAAALGLRALALTDRNGLYGIVRFAEAARAVALPTVFGVELDCAEAGDIVLLARGSAGYARMARAVSEGQLAGHKGAPVFTIERVGQTVHSHCVVLTGGTQGAVVRALEQYGPRAAELVLHQLQWDVTD